MGDFFKVSLFNKATGKSSDLYLEAGVTFENKNFSYKMDESGNFNVFDKEHCSTGVYSHSICLSFSV